MSDILKVLSDAVEQIKNLSPEMLLGVFTIALGYMLRVVKFFSNRYIPVVVVFSPMITYPILTGGLHVGMDGYSSSLLRLAMRGFLIGFVSWAIHGLILKKLEAVVLKRFGKSSLEEALKAGDTEHTVKPDEKSSTPVPPPNK